jgi:hypothetical protein
MNATRVRACGGGDQRNHGAASVARRDALGKRFRLDSNDAAGRNKRWMPVVGVITDAKQQSWSAGADEEMYLPFLQDASYLHNPAGYLSMTLVARTGGPVSALAPLVRERIRAIDRNIPIAAMTSMEQVVDDAMWQTYRWVATSVSRASPWRSCWPPPASSQ